MILDSEETLRRTISRGSGSGTRYGAGERCALPEWGSMIRSECVEGGKCLG